MFIYGGTTLFTAMFFYMLIFKGFIDIYIK